MLQSSKCKYEQLSSPEFRRWLHELKIDFKPHRKDWEYAYIAQSLFERGMLDSGKTGIGFGVCTEPLPSLFAKHGCSIVATDRRHGHKMGWDKSGLESVYKKGIVKRNVFYERVRFEYVDMNSIPDTLYGKFDFVWSCCALEHIGSCTDCLDFVVNSLRCLKPNGVAVHTTELLVDGSKHHARPKDMPTVFFSESDMKSLADKLKGRMKNDFSDGDTEYDKFIDVEPHKQEIHLKAQFGNLVTTSYGLIVHG